MVESVVQCNGVVNFVCTYMYTVSSALQITQPKVACPFVLMLLVTELLQLQLTFQDVSLLHPLRRRILRRPVSKIFGIRQDHRADFGLVGRK
jgi:hypothetical protein